MFDAHGQWVELEKPVSIRRVMIAYNLRDKGMNLPEIALVHWPDVGDISRFWHSTTGACYTHLHERSSGPERRQCFVHSTALGLIMRDGYPWQTVHEALWWVKEYRDGLVPDQRSPNGKTVAAPGVL